MLNLLYAGLLLHDKPITLKHVAKAERNAEIRIRYAAGAILKELAAEYGISYQRIYQIVRVRQS
jgi:Mor family transcriptional regulator